MGGALSDGCVKKQTLGPGGRQRTWSIPLNIGRETWGRAKVRGEKEGEAKEKKAPLCQGGGKILGRTSGERVSLEFWAGCRIR